MSFAFLPRKVGQPKAKQPAQSSKVSATNIATGSVHVHDDPSHDHHRGPKSRKAPSETPAQELSRLAELALSDYAISQNKDLCMILEEGEEGFIPLTWLLHNSPVFKHVSIPPSVASAAKAIREHASDTLELRMALTEPSASTWRTLHMSDTDDGGGYEVRRKEHFTMYLNTIKWDDRTVYVERVPHAHWTLSKLALFIDSIVGTNKGKSVQNVELPAHQFDKPGAVPRCKGFALVVLSSVEDAEYLAQSWPWEVTELSSSSSGQEEQGITKEARSSGFRVLRKVEWERLKAEYLGYRQFLLSQLAEDPFLRDDSEEPQNEEDVIPEQWSEEEEGMPPLESGEAEELPADAPFPPGCLLFLRGVHPRTNRTVIRTLLGSALAQHDMPSEGVDYVDYTKGMDTCHVRVAAASHALALVNHFATNSLAQDDAADSIGTPVTTADIVHIMVEQVLGRPEELYWERVPEKVRQVAVQKARQAAGYNVPPPQSSDAKRVDDDEVETRKRKRRRRA